MSEKQYAVALTAYEIGLMVGFIKTEAETWLKTIQFHADLLTPDELKVINDRLEHLDQILTKFETIRNKFHKIGEAEPCTR